MAGRSIGWTSKCLGLLSLLVGAFSHPVTVQSSHFSEPRCLLPRPEDCDKLDYCLQCSKICTNASIQLSLDVSSCANSTSFCMKDSCLESIPDSVGTLHLLQVLNLSCNGISDIPEGLLYHLAELRVLNLAFNKILKLRSTTFERLSHLEELYLQNNLLEYVEPRTFLANLTRLRIVNLSNNLLVTIDTWPLTLPGAKHGVFPSVDLSRNMIHKVTNELGLSIEDIQESDRVRIDLSQNKLRFARDFRATDLLRVGRWSDFLRMSGMEISVADNPFECDCDMLELVGFARKLNHFFQRNGPLGNPNADLMCAGPQAVEGTLISYVADTDFRCPAEQGCPPGCNCTRTASNETVTVVCREWPDACMPGELPASKHVQLYMENGKLISLSDRPYLSNTTILSLSGNLIAQVDLAALTRLNHLRQLDLSYNRLESYPENFTGQTFDELERINIGANPLNCDCELLSWLQPWLRNHLSVVTSAENVLCRADDDVRRPVLTVSLEELCDRESSESYQLLVVLAVIAVGATLIFVVLILWLVKRYSCVMKAWAHRFLLWNTGRYLKKRAKHAGSLKLEDYDLFVSYTEDASDWVNDALVPQLKDFKVCVHETDFVAGFSVIDNIVNAIEGSRRTIMVLSPESLRSEWCQMEFNMSEVHVSEGRRAQTVVLVLEQKTLIDLAAHNRPLHRHIMKHGSHNVHHPDFWESFQKSLKQPTDDRARTSQEMEELLLHKDDQ